jgi:hypothetical protein
LLMQILTKGKLKTAHYITLEYCNQHTVMWFSYSCIYMDMYVLSTFSWCLVCACPLVPLAVLCNEYTVRIVYHIWLTTVVVLHSQSLQYTSTTVLRRMSL